MTKLRDDFCVFILSYGRPNDVKTLETLQKAGYSGQYFIVVSDDDGEVDNYKKKFGSKVCVFNKLEQAKYFDIMDNRKEATASIIYARNYCFKLAQNLGYRYFLELDDDYHAFSYRYAEDDKLKAKPVKDIDAIFELTLQLLDDTDALTVAYSQGGDLIGGLNGSNFKKGLLRKAMNSFFIDTHKPFQFLGRINEDVNMYVDNGAKGKKIFQVTNISIDQEQTQSHSTGMTELYLDYGTYAKSFYSVMIQPSFVKLSKMGTANPRIHHQVDWRHGVPKIINPKYKK